jgi:hypothetical protein
LYDSLRAECIDTEAKQDQKPLKLPLQLVGDWRPPSCRFCGTFG